MVMTGEQLGPGDGGKMREALGPHALDQAIRQAISICWMLLPEGKKSVEAVEAEVRRVVDRALKDLREDAAAFGIPHNSLRRQPDAGRMRRGPVTAG